MLIADVLGRHGLGVIALLPDTLVAGAALLLAEQSIGAGVIIDPDGGMVGIISERDIMRGLGRHGAAVAGMCVAELMTRDVITCDSESTVADALATMQSMNVRHLPVVDGDNHLVGMISMRDLVNVQAPPLAIAG
jgi:CBS domain-containing protein